MSESMIKVQRIFISFKYCFKNCYLDSNGNPVTETIQSIVVTDSSGNPVTGKVYYDMIHNYNKDDMQLSN